MFGRSVTAFRKNVIESKPCNTVPNSDKVEDFDTCNVSLVATSPLPIASYASKKQRRFSLNSNSPVHISVLRKRSRSQSVNREGEKFLVNEILKIAILEIMKITII